MDIQLIDHIVLMVKDITVTTKFYSAFLGEPEFQDSEQVCWKVGDTKIFFGLPNAEYVPHNKDSYGINHLAFRVGNREELRQLAQKLHVADISHSDIQKDTYSGNDFIWLDDPDGYRIEFYVR